MSAALDRESGESVEFFLGFLFQAWVVDNLKSYPTVYWQLTTVLK